MGYTTEFDGQFDIVPPMKPEHVKYLRKFARSRRFRRNNKALENHPDPLRTAVELPLGFEGEFFVGQAGDYCDDRTGSIDYNQPPSDQPGLWCDWEPSEDGLTFEWNGTEKFYYYTEWLHYLLTRFLAPWGYRLQGEVHYQGEDRSDWGDICCDIDGGNTVLTVKHKREEPKVYQPITTQK